MGPICLGLFWGFFAFILFIQYRYDFCVFVRIHSSITYSLFYFHFLFSFIYLFAIFNMATGWPLFILSLECPLMLKSIHVRSVTRIALVDLTILVICWHFIAFFGVPISIWVLWFPDTWPHTPFQPAVYCNSWLILSPVIVHTLAHLTPLSVWDYLTWVGSLMIRHSQWGLV